MSVFHADDTSARKSMNVFKRTMMIQGWKTQMEREYLRILGKCGPATPQDIAARLGVSESCAVFWLTELARDGQVRITVAETVANGEQTPA